MYVHARVQDGAAGGDTVRRGPATPPRGPDRRGHGGPRAPPRLDGLVGAVGVDVVDRRERLVRRRDRRADRLGAAGQAVEDRDDADDLVARLADRVDRLDGRAAGGHDVLDDETAVARLEQRPLDPALEAVLLEVLAHEERLDLRAAGERRARRRVGPHREPADRGRAPGLRALGDELGERLEAGGPQDRALRVDVVLRGPPAREHDLAHDERMGAKLVDQPVAGAHAARDSRGRVGGIRAGECGTANAPRALRPARAGRHGRTSVATYAYTSTMSPRVSQLKIGTASCIGTRRQPWLAGKTGTDG